MRLQIIILNRGVEVYTTYVDVESAMRFLIRANRWNNFSVLATKNGKCVFFDKPDAAAIRRQLVEFQNATN